MNIFFCTQIFYICFSYMFRFCLKIDLNIDCELMEAGLICEIVRIIWLIKNKQKKQELHQERAKKLVSQLKDKKGIHSYFSFTSSNLNRFSILSNLSAQIWIWIWNPSKLIETNNRIHLCFSFISSNWSRFRWLVPIAIYRICQPSNLNLMSIESNRKRQIIEQFAHANLM